MKIALVAAIGSNNEIGAHGNLLWHLPADLKRFKEITLGHHVLMGRKTYESIPAKFRPLPGRENIVLTSNKHYTAQGCKVVHSIEEGIQIASTAGDTALMIIGGGEIYALAMPLATTLYITKVEGTFPDADAFFPAWSNTDFVLTEQEHFSKDDKHAFNFSFLQLEKRSSM